MHRTGKVVILLGPPGAGKGTQAQLISRSLGVPAISTGEMLRQECQSGSDLGRQVQGLLASGQLAGDELMQEVIKRRLSEADCEEGCILDGYPRTVSQAMFLDGLLVKLNLNAPIIFDLLVNANELIHRLSLRRQCGQCGFIMSVAEDSGSEPTYCGRDGSVLARRVDDNPITIRERLRVYRRNTGDLVRFYRTRNYHRIAASRTPDAVTSELMNVLSAKLLSTPDYKPSVLASARIFA